jgi:hypothetical protein
MADKTFELTCSCGCSKLVASYWDDDDYDAVALMHYSHSWRENSRPVRRGLKQMFSLIWCALVGKEYLFYDVVIERDRLDEFKKFVESL